MARKKTVYVCGDCGDHQPKWVGRCPNCRAWNTMSRMSLDAAASDVTLASDRASDGAQPIPLSDVATEHVARRAVGIGEFDRVLGGGLVPGALVLLAGEPGIGKSTLALQAAARLGDTSPPVLYVSGEESAEQMKLRAGRLALADNGLWLLAETDLDAVLHHAARLAPTAIVIDSIQTARLESVPSAAGSVAQVRECTARLMRLAKTAHVPVFLVGHVTKSGDIAGPRIMEHMVDVVLHLEGDRYHAYRLLRGVKNRFGSTDEVGVFEMRPEGLVEVANPSAEFLAERLPGAPGSAVTVTMEGSRPLLVEVQALASPSQADVPRRTANGVDFGRLLLLSAVLAKRLGLSLSRQDLFVNVVGGMRVSEPAADLAIAAAVASSAKALPIRDGLVLLGEVGLSGELRSIAHLERRLAEAAKLGFQGALVPATERGAELERHGLRVHGHRTVVGALRRALGTGGRAVSVAEARGADRA